MALTALISSTVLINILGYSSSVHAASSTIDLSATIAPSINVTIPTNLVSLNVNPINSALATSTIPVTVGTNNEYGYSLIMSSSTTDLTRTEALTNNTIPTISTLEDKAGGYTVNDFTINRWGYNINSSNYNSYTSGVELSSTTTKTNADTTNVGFAARADYDTPAGIYELDLTFLATAKPPLYTINYTDNSGDTSVTGTPINPAQSSTGTAGTGITISTSMPTRDHYTFLGWCNTATTSDGTVCPTTTYSPGSNYQITETDELTMNFYAVWTLNTYNLVIAGDSNLSSMTLRQGSTSGTTINGTKSGNNITFTNLIYGTSYYLYPVFNANYEFSSWAKTDSAAGSALGSTSTENTYYTIGEGNGALALTSKSSRLYLQNVTTANCPSTATTAYDIRDEKPYLIQKLADNNCWMLDNLRLDISNSGVQSKMTSSTTNATDTILGYLKNGGGSSPYTGTAVANVSSGFITYNTPLINTASSETTTTGYGSGSGKIGVYYNYCAATAGSYCYASNAGSGNASYDICPAGWRMPTGGSSGEYQALYTAYSSNATNFRNALSTPLSGYYYNNRTYDQGGYGYFWSSTYYSSDRMLYLRVGSSNVTPQDNGNRLNGFPVRCVAKSGDTLQEFNGADADRMAIGDTKTLIDNRDNKEYLVGKLKDGNVWLLDNLRLDISNATVQTKLGAATTNATDTILGYLKNGGGSSPYAGAKVTTTWSYSYNIPIINTGYVDVTTTSYGAGSGKIGVYYNYCAATAGSYCYAENAGSGNASYDICPAGWRMPTGNDGEYRALYMAYSLDVNNFLNALSTPLSGKNYVDSVVNQGSEGDYWSSTYYGGSIMYILEISSSSVGARSANARGFGYSVRCIAK